MGASVGSVLVSWGWVECLSSGDYERAALFGPAGLYFRKSHCASWMLLMSFLLDMAVRAMTRHLNICSKLGESRPQTTSP